jgi:hypothetical protein
LERRAARPPAHTVVFFPLLPIFYATQARRKLRRADKYPQQICAGALRGIISRRL